MSSNARRSIAKITMPAVSGVFQRKRLFELLDNVRKTPVVWIMGPPGSGKTTLATSYLKIKRIPCLWYQVDAGDADIASFFYYLGIAANRAAPRRKPLPLLTPEYLAGLPAFTRHFFEALYLRLKQPFAVVFDNYQDAAAESQLHEAMAVGLSDIPKGISVIILSRAEPPPALARLHANNAIARLGWDELSLTMEESRGIAKLYGRHGDEKLLQQLHEKAHGWAAGLALMLEEAGSASIAVGGGESGHKAVFDYLAGEILHRADEQTQSVLLQSSFLPKMYAGLIEKLTGIPEAGEILSALASRRYFTYRLTAHEPVYQYHPLFREFLLTTAKNTCSENVNKERRHKAALLLEAGGEAEDAVDILHDIHAYEESIRIILKHAAGLLEQGRDRTVEKWLKRLPEQALHSSAHLLYYLGLCQIAYDPTKARGYLEQAYRMFEEKGERTCMLRAWCAVIETFVYEWANFRPMVPWIEEMEKALTDDPAMPVELDSHVACSMFIGLMYSQPQHPNMTYWTERAWQIVLNSQDMQLCAKIAPHLVLYYSWWTADLAKAELILNALRPHIDRASVPPLARITWYVMSAIFYWMMAKTKECIAAADKGLALAKETGVYVWDMLLCSQGVFATLFNDDADSAEPYFNQIENIPKQSRTLDENWYYYLNTARYLFRNELSKAHEYIQISVAMIEDGGWIWAIPHVWIGHSLVLFYEGRREDAIVIIRKARDKNAALYLSPTHEFLSYLIEAEFALYEKDEAACLNLLSSALSIGRRHNFQYYPWWRSDVMARLYAKALEHNIETDYVTATIKKRGLTPPIEEAAPEAWPLPLRVYTLGRFNVLIDNKPLRFTSRAQKKPLELLKALLSLEGKNVSEGRIIDALWPESEGDASHISFKTTLHRLRQLLGSENALEFNEGSLTLNRRYCYVDVWAFERLLYDGESQLAKGNKLEAVGLIEKAVKMYRGHFLSTESEKAVAAHLTERLKDKFLKAVETLGVHYENSGEIKKSIELFKKGLEIDKLSEELYQHLIKCYLKLGQKADAIIIYKRCEREFSESFGIEPSEETKALYKKNMD